LTNTLNSVMFCTESLLQNLFDLSYRDVVPRCHTITTVLDIILVWTNTTIILYFLFYWYEWHKQKVQSLAYKIEIKRNNNVLSNTASNIKILCLVSLVIMIYDLYLSALHNRCICIQIYQIFNKQINYKNII